MCNNLVSIYVSNKWDTSNVTSSTNMFYNCTNLVGGSGTTYDSSHIDKAYAHNDEGITNPGYLTEVEVFAEFDSSTGVLRIFRDTVGTYTNGQTSGTKTYYAGIEDITGNTNPLWYDNKTNITSVVIEDKFRPQTTYKMFYECTNLTSITGMSNLDTSQATNMMGMFYHCSSLTSIDLSGFDTSLVTDMSSMFAACSGLTSLNVSSFNTENVTAMNSMFYGCSDLTSIDLSGFNTSNVTFITGMFQKCSSLRSLNLSSFDTGKLRGMSSMFRDCTSLTTLDLSSFNTSNVTTMAYMFTNIRTLKVLKLGTNFSFVGTNQELTGNWRRDGDTIVYTAANLVANYNGSTMAGTYRRIPDGEAYAEFDSSTGVLRIFRDDAGIYTNGQTSGTKTYYTGIESITNTTNPKWYSNNPSITSVVIEDEFIPLTAYRMFSGCSNLTNITGISNLNTSQVTNMNSMFYNCRSLRSLDVSDFNTSSVTDMAYMFGDEIGKTFTNLDVSNFDTSNVTSMTYMFYRCSSLTSLDVSNFNTSKVTSMFGMFSNCDSLTSLDVSNFDTSNVTNMALMFNCCSSLTSLDVSNFNTSKVTDMSVMFDDCNSLTNLDVTSFNTSNVTNMSYMFYHCSSLTSLNLSNFDTSNVTNMNMMLAFEDSLKVLKLGTSFIFTSDEAYLSGNWRRDGDTTIYTATDLMTNYNGSTMSGTYRKIPDGEAYAEFDSSTGVLRIFRDDAGIYTNGQTSGTKTYYTGIETITGSVNPRWYSNRASITSVVIEDEFMPLTAYYMFGGCTNLTSITGLSNLDTSQVTNMRNMFQDCSSLTNLDVSNFNTSNVTDMRMMFYKCTNPTSITGLSHFDTSQVTNMYGMFMSCSCLTSLDVSNFNTSNVTDMSYMFWNCSNLISLDVSSFNTSQVTNMDSTFYNCSSLTSLNLINFNTSQVTTTKSMFDGCSSLTSLDLSSFNTSQVTDISRMFYGCRSLTSLDITNFNTSNVTNMSSMFYHTNSLNTLKLGTDWNFLSSNSLSKSWLRDGDTTVYTAAQLTNAYDGSTMSGTYRAVQALTITETVKGTMAETNKEFDFTINVTNGGVGIDSTHAYTGTKSGNLVFNNGVATFTLKHADSITTYLPYGVSYTITQDSDGYTLSRTNYTGILGTDITSTFTDTLNGTVPTGIESNNFFIYLTLFFTAVTIIFIYLVYRTKRKQEYN